AAGPVRVPGRGDRCPHCRTAGRPCLAGRAAVKTAAERYAALVRLVESRTVTRVNPPLLLPADPFFDLAGEEFGRTLLLTTASNGLEYCLRPDFTLPIAQAYL